jgi:hypothetical protein
LKIWIRTGPPLALGVTVALGELLSTLLPEPFPWPVTLASVLPFW